MSNKKAQTCSKTVLGSDGLRRNVYLLKIGAKSFGDGLEIRTFVRIQRVIWDHLLAFKAEIIQK